MKKILIFILGLILISGCVNQPKEEFCGSSSYESCNINSDCRTGGCSGQLCRSKSGEPIVSICDYRECYDASKFGLECKCVNDNCQWS